MVQPPDRAKKCGSIKEALLYKLLGRRRARVNRGLGPFRKVFNDLGVKGVIVFHVAKLLITAHGASEE